MKVLLVVFSCLIAAGAVGATSYVPLPPETEAKFKKCQKELGVSDQLVKKVVNHDFSFSDDKLGKCYVKCICRATGFCDADLKIDVSELKDLTETSLRKVRFVRLVRQWRMEFDYD